ncbi:MAG: RNA-binding protein [Promethearchaeota archaeon]
MKVRRRFFVSKKEARRLREDLAATLGAEAGRLVPQGSKVERMETDDGHELLVVDGKVTFWLVDGKPVPLLDVLLANPGLLKHVVVDSGAVPHVLNGADVMRPGVVSIDEGVAEGDVVAVVEETRQTPVAVGVALGDAEALLNQRKGKVAKNLHTASDKVWKFKKELDAGRGRKP